MFSKPSKATHIFHCPDCGAVEAIRIADITRDGLDAAGNVVEEVIGHRKACQRCPKVYSTAPTGTFTQHPHSLPLTPEYRATAQPEIQQNGPLTPPRMSPLIPRERPAP